MQDIVKKKMNVSDANGWYLAERVYRKWNEDFIDEDTGEDVPIERHEVIAPVGDQLTEISISMLQENGIVEVFVSNKKITGSQQKFMSLWQLECVSYDSVAGKDKSDYYIIPKGSPLECEIFFREWAELNINGEFTIKKVVPLDFSAVLLPFDDEVEDAVKKHIDMRFYKAVIKPFDGASRKVLASADALHTIEAAVTAQYKCDRIVERISEIKEINVKKLFEDGLSIARYTLGLYNPNIESHFIKALDDLDNNADDTRR